MKYLVIASMIALLSNLNICYACSDIYGLDIISSQILFDKGEAHMLFMNNGQDTVYLFSSYLNDQKSKLRYLYRINQKQDTVKISFLPIIPLLYCHQSFLKTYWSYKNPINMEETLVTEALYNFIIIPPKQIIYVYFHIQNIFNKTKYIKDEDVDLVNMHINTILKRPEQIEVERENIKIIILEFAIYKHIKDITLDCYINKPWLFNNAVKDYSIFKLVLSQQIKYD